MNMAGEQRIAAPRARVWEALNDPGILRASIPGCQSLEKVADDRFTATVEVKVGPIGARFKGAVSLADLDPPYGYTLILDGNGGIAGSVKGSAKVRLNEDAGGTLIPYEVQAQVGGRMAQLGGPIIDATAKQLAGKFFSRFGEIVGAEAISVPPLAPQVAPVSVPALPTAAVAAPAGGLPVAWILATVVAALVGFLVGRGQGAGGSDWAGLSIGLLLIVVASAAFEYGRRAAAPVLVLDNALLRRLIANAKQDAKE
ncbi:MAG: carbon monoxide dehydrogenase subunit G [Gammaproteobacteria bacterium]|jgi:carbon monoxide dehydrogenase subunit G|nr:carbon monoxide dehydrogenase subunit G [Gammaproteobacteria bacterium]MBK8990643.1 carbon monoxide dehydrogenase subunit G [Gammaproteobacteria bacterium]MBK9466809.1 carbon monoxide dehydrogenase subunit G [Gammaproteobacteria bacterium]MBP6480523.1 carbon monoxide dehydrogenase subunit G [Pseudomonadales bacterium]MBP7911037.1 carbon monoxide dehydrogenase subunit G [Pseudomonadales bacterium]